MFSGTQVFPYTFFKILKIPSYVGKQYLQN